MRDELSGLTVLMAVANRRSFTGAAAELRVSASAVSQAIAALEERVGVRLLQRTTRSVSLTEAGARFVARVAPALEGVRDAYRSLESLRDRPAGLLRVRTLRVGYALVLQPRLAAFLAAFPDIRLEVSFEEGVDLVSAGFDAGIHLGETIGRDMIAVRVSEDQRIAVVGSPAYFAKHPRPKHPRDLHAHDCINYRNPDGSIYRWELTDRGKEIEIAVDGRLAMNDRELMVTPALEGVGLAYVAESRVREHLAHKRLVRVLEAYCPPFPGLFLYYPSRAQIAPKLVALVEHLRLARRKR
jgi:DNA-binding transcriptional LysR family regulator